MIRIYSLFILISIFTAYSVFASETTESSSDRIGQNEIAQTMKSMNDLMAAPSKRSAEMPDENSVGDMPMEAAPAPQSAAQADEKFGLQRSADVLSNLEDESDND